MTPFVHEKVLKGLKVRTSARANLFNRRVHNELKTHVKDHLLEIAPGSPIKETNRPVWLSSVVANTLQGLTSQNKTSRSLGLRTVLEQRVNSLRNKKFPKEVMQEGLKAQARKYRLKAAERYHNEKVAAMP